MRWIQRFGVEGSGFEFLTACCNGSRLWFIATQYNEPCVGYLGNFVLHWAMGIVKTREGHDKSPHSMGSKERFHAAGRPVSTGGRRAFRASKLREAWAARHRAYRSWSEVLKLEVSAMVFSEQDRSG